MPDVEERIAAWELDRETCHEHGGPRSECDDADTDLYPQRHICYRTMQIEAARRRYADLHKERPYHDGSFKVWAKEASPDFPFHYDDGVTQWLATEDLAPWDMYLEREAASPVRPDDWMPEEA